MVPVLFLDAPIFLLYALMGLGGMGIVLYVVAEIIKTWVFIKFK